MTCVPVTLVLIGTLVLLGIVGLDFASHMLSLHRSAFWLTVDGFVMTWDVFLFAALVLSLRFTIPWIRKRLTRVQPNVVIQVESVPPPA